ncbi:hypothetical protein [Streptomyces filamentosus]|uniref:hypothetical protein n=1 Tax=Streptomyces filamentosus TaxID=67294 RepID=UPI0033D5C731
MNVETVAEWKQMLEQLATEDQAGAVEATHLRQALERELAQAREHEQLMISMAQDSRDALVKTSKWLKRLMDQAGSAHERPGGANAASQPAEMAASFTLRQEK